jgi:hypothetical protein
VTNDAPDHLHYLHVNFKSLVMKEEDAQITLIQWNDIKKCWVYTRYAYQTLHIDNYFLACTSYQLSVSSFHTLHVWYITSCLLWFNYDPYVICFIPNACFKFRKWHLTYFHYKNLERKSTPRLKRDQRSHKHYFTLVMHVFFPKTTFSYKWIFEWFGLQIVMKTSPLSHKKKFNNFLTNMNVYKCTNPCSFYVSSWKMMIIWNHTKKY